MGCRALVVTGRNISRAEPVIAQLKKEKIKCVTFSATGEPTTTVVKSAMEEARRAECDVVVAVGGGSVMDTAKTVAAMLTNEGELEDYLEVVGRGKRLNARAAASIMLPTTAGTGAEVTYNAVIGVPEHRRKVSMRSVLMAPHLAVIDPELTYSMPPDITASSGLDALTQLLEAFVCKKGNPLIDGVCREGLRLAARSLRRAYEDGGDKAARRDMCLASLFSGLALANAGLGAVHGLAGTLGGEITAPHGVICARLLPYVMEANVKALQKRAPDSEVLGRYDEIAQLLTGKVRARGGDGVAWVHKLCEELKVAALGEFGLKRDQFETICEKSRQSSSMKGNPIELTNDEMRAILDSSLR
jgi:alcohol dehydrogenase class IV